MSTVLHSRAETGLRPPKASASPIASEGVTAHYGGPSPWGPGPDRSSAAAFRDSTDHARCASIWRAWQAFHMDARGWNDIAYNCVDEATEILTESGWRSVGDLRVGDIALTLNHESGMSEWQPVLAVNIFPAPAALIEMTTDRHSSVTTPNHRWPVERSRFGRKPHSVIGVDRLFVTTGSFGYWDRVPVAADCADLPAVAKHDDGFVELVAWFWTEGTIMRGRSRMPAANVGICQAYTAVDRCDRIRSALRRCFGPPVDRMPRLGARTDGVPRWREYRNGHKAEFWLSADAGRLVQQHAPGRVPTFDFLRSLTRAQLALFIETSMLADNAGPAALAQKDRAAAEAFQFAVLLAGYGSSLHTRPPTSSTPYEMWQVRIRKQRHFGPRRIAQRRVVGAGVVWCPTTPNGTWLARRAGTVYFTGNSGVCPHGHRYEGRGPDRRSGANGTTTGNARSEAVCYLAGDDDPLTDEARAAFLDEAARMEGGRLRWDHSDWKPTACAGNPIRAWEAEGWPPPGGPVTPAPPTQPVVPPPITGGRYIVNVSVPLLRRGSTGQHVGGLQGILIGKAGQSIKIDGDFGPATEAAVKNWQTFFGLTVDGIVGPATWTTLVEIP